MISIVKITDKDNLPCRYASRLDAFSNGREYVFRPGVNIIVGNNGCGKTTLIRMIAYFMFCDSSMKSQIPDESYKYPDILDEPDRNLDIDNIESLINILSFHKERTQLITVIHNPLVIWRLSDNKSVNFVEMTEGYVEKVRNVIEKGRRYGK